MSNSLMEELGHSKKANEKDAIGFLHPRLLALRCIEREKDNPSWALKHAPSTIRADVLNQLD
jgi:hypothetical protein